MLLRLVCRYEYSVRKCWTCVPLEECQECQITLHMVYTLAALCGFFAPCSGLVSTPTPQSRHKLLPRARSSGSQSSLHQSSPRLYPSTSTAPPSHVSRHVGTCMDQGLLRIASTDQLPIFFDKTHTFVCVCMGGRSHRCSSLTYSEFQGLICAG